MASKGIDLEIYRDTAPSVLVDVLNNRIEPQSLAEFGNGGFSFKILKSDPKLVANPTLLDFRNIVRIRDNGVAVGAFIIQTKKSVIVGEGETSAEAWMVSGEGYIADSASAIVFPAGGLKSTSKETRYFNFASERGSWYNASQWVDATRISKWNQNVTWWRSAPAQWPDAPDAWWIWDRTTTPHPQGYVYFRHEFTTSDAAAQQYSFFFAVDDRAEVYVDGELVFTTAEHAWMETNRLDMELLAGNHIIALKAYNYKSDGPGSLIGALFKVGDASSPTSAQLISTTGNSTWKILPYPSEEPGWTPGDVLLTLLNEAKARNVRFAKNVTPTFTVTQDSNGQAWDKLPMSFDVGTDYLKVIESLDELACDFYLDPETLALNAYKKRGVDRSETGSGVPVRLEVAKNLLSADETGQANIANRLLVRTSEGWVLRSPSSTTSETTFGVVESQVTTDLSVKGSEALTAEIFRQKSMPETSATFVITPVPGAVPFVDFNVGDYVSAPGAVKGILESRRVMSISIAELDNGTTQYAVEFDTIFQDRQTELERLVTNATGAGTVGGTAFSSTTSLPSTVVQGQTPVVIINIPDAPTGVIATPTARWSDTGTAVADVSLQWSPVFSSGNNTISDVIYYEVWGKKTAEQNYRRITTVTTVNALLPALESGSSWMFMVRAISRTSGEGNFSEPVTASLPFPVAPLGAPAAPQLSTSKGAVTIRWTGTLGGSTPPAHFFNMVVQRRNSGSTGAFTDITTFYTASANDNSVNVGSTYEYRLVPVDSLGNRGTASPTASIKVVGVVGAEIDSQVTDAITNANTKAEQAVAAVAGKTATYPQPNQPSGGTYVVGDIWYDTDDDYKMYYWSGTQWVPATFGSAALSPQLNAVITAANGKNKNYYQATKPTGGTYVVGDTWFDTANSNRMSVWTGSDFVLVQDSAAALAAALSKNGSFMQATAPTATKTGDIWIDTANNNQPKVWNGTAWVDARDKQIAFVEGKADTALSAANGKNTIMRSTSVASNPGNYKQNDIWWQFVGTEIIGMWIHNGTAWVSQTLRDEVISNLNAATITAGFINVDRLQSNSISTQKLLVGDFTNLIEDEDFEAALGLTWRRRTGAASASDFAVTNGLPGKSWKLDGVGTEVSVESVNLTPVDPGTQYRFNARAQNQLTGTSPLAYVRIYWYKEDKANSSVSYSQVTIPVSGWADYSAIITTPADAFYGRIVLIHGNNNTAGSWWIGRMALRRMNNAELIVDGSITATKLAANSIAVGTAAIQDGAIVNAMIANATIESAKIKAIDAAKITTGTLDADRIGSNSITSKHIAIGDFTNMASGSDFEDTRLVPWDISAGAFSVVSNMAQSGTRSLRVTGGGSAPLTTKLDVNPGEQYYFELWARKDADYNGSGSNAKLRIGNQASALLTDLQYGSDVLITDTWVKRVKTFTVPANVTSLSISLVTNHSTGTLWLDNIIIRRMTGSTLIEDGAITTDKVAANSINASHIIAGTITGDKIAANQISVRQLLVSNLTNLAEDPSFESNVAASGARVSAGWTLDPTQGTPRPTITTTNSRTGSYALQIPTAAGAYVAAVGKNPIQVEGGEKYIIGAWVRMTTGTAGASGVALRFKYGATETTVTTGSADIRTSTTAYNTTYQYLSGVWTVPTGTKFATPEIVMRDITTGKVYTVDDVFVAKQVGSTLIEDNSITTGKIIVTDMSNALENPYWDAGFAGWTRGGAAGGWSLPQSTSGGVNYYIQRVTGSTASGSSNYVNDYRLPVQQGKRLKISGKEFNLGSTLNATIGVVFYTETGATLGSPVTMLLTPDEGWDDIPRFEVDVPSGAYYASLRIADSGNTNSTLRLANLRFAIMNTAELIVDGTITGAKIKAESIESEQIGVGAIRTRHINADDLASLELSSNVSINLAITSITTPLSEELAATTETANAAATQGGLNAVQGSLDDLAAAQTATQGAVSTMQTWFRVDAEGAHVGQTGSSFQTHIKPDRFEITQGPTVSTYWTSDKMVVPKMEAIEASIANHQFVKFGEGLNAGTVIKRLSA